MGQMQYGYCERGILTLETNFSLAKVGVKRRNS